ncbi:MAG: hypothetical protein Q7R87_00520 [Nanoarchaeota archaeon]|nr:hypothetical protein [Nanoarchaeota archaeon]
MKNKVLFLFFFALLVSLSFVSAASVQINISSYDSHKVYITILKPGASYFFIDSFSGKTDAFGKYTKTFETTEAKLKYIIVVKNEAGEAKFTEKIDSQDTTEGIDLYLGVEKPVVEEKVVEPVVNVTNVSVVNTTVSDVSSNNSVSGFSISAVSDSFKKLPSWVYYSLLGLLVVGLLGFYISKNGFPMPSFKHTSSVSSSSISPISTQVSISSDNVSSLTKQIDEAEQKIKDARSQINKMKNQDKIKQMEERLRKEREELDKLKNGED